MSDVLTDEIARDLQIVNEAIDMIEREDLSHWSTAHDRVTRDALQKERRALLIERETGMRQQALPLSDCGSNER